MVDGDVTKAYYDEMMNQMGDVDFDDKNLDDANKARLNEAIRAQYGSTAKYEDGKIKYEKDGETVELEMDNEGLKNLIATQYATELTSSAAQYTDDAIRRM
jgi:hypothetical protein